MFLFMDRSRFRTSFAFVAAVLAFACFPGASHAQLFGGNGLFNRNKDDAPVGLSPEQIGIPTPVTGKVEAVKGMEIQFEIHAQSKTPAAKVEFLIRTFPSAGKITSLVDHPSKRNAAVVTYYADPGSTAESDAFAFAVRYRGGRYSSAMRYDISLGEVKSEISTDKEIDFGAVAVGSSVEKEITVRNLGKAEFSTRLALSPPWYLVDPADGNLALSGNGVRKVKVEFRPNLPGETTYFLSFSRSKHGTTKLIGQGGEPFRLVTQQATLALDERSGKRIGELVLLNPGVKPVRVLARGSNRLGASLEKEYFLPPGKPRSIKVALAATDTAPFDGMVQFYLETGLTKTVQVVAPVVPGSLQLSIPGSVTTELINFGQVKAGEMVDRSIILTNPGGVAVPLEFHIPSPFRLLNDPGPALAPMGSVNIAIGLNPPVTSRGPVDVTMNIFGNEQTLPIRLMGNVLKSKSGTGAAAPGNLPKGLPMGSLRLSSGRKDSSVSDSVDHAGSEEEKAVAAIGSPSSSVGDPVIIGSDRRVPKVGSPRGDDGIWFEEFNEEQMEALTSPLGNLTRPIKGRDVNLNIRRPEDLSILKTDSDSITLAWTAPRESDIYDFEVELSGMLDGGSGMPVHAWIPYENVKIKKVDRLVKAEIRNLMPKTTYEFRVFTVDENGRSSAPSDGMYAETQLPMDWTYIYLIVSILCLAILGLGVAKIIQSRRPEVYQAQYVDD